MTRKKKVMPTLEDVHPEWIIFDEIQINGRNIMSGTEISITSEKGRFRFIKYVKTPSAEWIDVIGGPKGSKMFRSFRPEQVKTVHWKNKLRESFKDSEKSVSN
jgi:hypothetical protein